MLGTQRECTKLTPYPVVHLTLLRWKRSKKRFKLCPVLPQQEVQQLAKEMNRENTKGSLLTF